MPPYRCILQVIIKSKDQDVKVLVIFSTSLHSGSLSVKSLLQRLKTRDMLVLTLLSFINLESFNIAGRVCVRKIKNPRLSPNMNKSPREAWGLPLAYCVLEFQYNDHAQRLRVYGSTIQLQIASWFGPYFAPKFGTRENANGTAILVMVLRYLFTISAALPTPELTKGVSLRWELHLEI